MSQSGTTDAVEGNRAKSTTMVGGTAPRPYSVAPGTHVAPVTPPPGASTRPKSVIVPGASVNTLKMKALFEGGGGGSTATLPPTTTSSSSSPSPALSASTMSAPHATTSTFPPPSPNRPLSSSAIAPTTAAAPAAAVATGAPVTRMKSFFEDKAREQQVGKGSGSAADQKKLELARKQEERLMKDRVEREFFETEENYFKSLDIVVEVYVKPLREAKIISQQDMDTIFSNIETIHQIHQRLYLDLKPLFCPETEAPATAPQPDDSTQPKLDKRPSFYDSATKSDSKTQKSLGDLLRAFIPFFKMYTVYINSFDNANKRITDLQNSSKKFTQFLNDCKARPECKKLDLVSFLIMPIQRLPRYELLLRDILRNTADASEHAKIEQVFNTVAEVNKHVNSEKGASILRARLYKLKAAVKHRVDIFSRPDRRLLREGEVIIRKVERPSESSRLNLDLNLPLPARKSEKNLSSERRSTVVGLDKDSFMTPRKADFKSQYFFLFDDFLLQVVKKSKSDKYIFRVMYNLLHINVLLVQQGTPTMNTTLGSSSSALLAPVGVVSGSGTHPLPTRSMSLKSVGVNEPQRSSSPDLTMEGSQNGDSNTNGEDNDNGSGEAAAINLESEGEIVDDPEAELMLLLVDHKSKDKIHIKFKSRHEKEDWLELIVNAKEEMAKLGLEGPKDLKEEAVAEKKAKEEKEKEEKELKKAQQEKEKKEKEAKMAQLQAQKEKENAMYKYDHMFKGIILPALAPSLKAQTDEICNSLVGVLADKDITELGAKMPFRLRTVRARNVVVKLQLWLQKPNDTPAGIPESALRGGLHTLIVAYDTTSAQSLETARAWIKEIKKLNPPIVGTLLAFHPTQSTDGEAVTAEAGQQAATEEGFVFFELGKVASVEEDALDSSFETIVERILDMKEGHGSALSPGGGHDLSKRRSVDLQEVDLKADKKKEGKLKGILGIGKKKLSRKTSVTGASNGSGGGSGGSSPAGNSKKESRG